MNLEGKEITVVGLARVGLAAARFALERGARVRATDLRSGAELSGSLAEALAGLEGRDLRLFLGGHPEEAFAGSELVIVSPGVPLSIEPLERARRRGLRVVGEVEFAAPYLGAPVVAVTGTNGKSTVTSLIGAMLAAGGRRPFVGGNLGRPIFEAIAPEPAGEGFDSLVLELSSYQLETLNALHPRVGVLLNISEDHLDRYESFDHYRRTKARLLALVPPEGTVVVNLDDPACVAAAEASRAHPVGFGLEGRRPAAGWSWISLEGEEALASDGERFDLSDFQPAGRHNRANALAAIAAARAFGVCAHAICRALAGFKGLPHRCEFVAEVAGVRYYDDSKATNVGAVCESLQGFGAPVILVAGGVGKGGSYEPLRRAARARVRRAILIGEAGGEIAAALEGVCQSERASTLEEAVERARQVARPGWVVLLAPACSSFDMFRDYAERGERFQAAVGRLSA